MLLNKINSETVLNISRYCAICAATIGPFSAIVMSVACVTMLVTWLLSGKIINLFKLSLSQPIGQALIVLFLVLCMGSLYSPVGFKQGISTLWNWRKVFYVFILLGIFQSNEWKRKFIVFYVYGMSLALILSYLAWFGIIPSKRGAGILTTDYTVQSMSFSVSIICCIVLLKKVHEAKIKYLLILLVILFSFNILFVSASRSGYLSLFVGGTVAILSTYGRKKIFHVALGSIFILIISFSMSKVLQDRVKLGLNEFQTYENAPQLTSIGARVVFFKNTLQLIKKHPIIGYGTGSFFNVYKAYITNKYNDWRSTPTGDPHNQYLFVFTENGLIGLFTFLWFIFVSLKQGFCTDDFGIIGGSILCAWLATSLFNSHFTTFMSGHLLGLFMGAMLAKIPNKCEIS